MAESEETRCIRLELSDGGHVYLRSVWETANFSIVVFDGFQAWSRSVSTKEVVSIARQWNIDVGDFMRSARARLSCQHPTSSYSMSADKDADVVNLSFTIDDLWEEKALDFQLCLEGVPDARAVVCEMLDDLVKTNDKLKEQLVEAEAQFQKKVRQLAAASEPKPSITLSLARSSANNPAQGRQSSSSPFLEPRLWDFTNKFKHLDSDRDTACCSPTRAHGQQQQQLVHDNNTSTRPPPLSFDLLDHHGIAKPTAMETEREVKSFFKRSSGGGRNNDLTVNMVALSPNIMRVLNSLSNGIDRGHGSQELDMGAAGGRDDHERGLKITEMRSPCREEEDLHLRSLISETKSRSMKIQENRPCNNGASDLIPEKGSSNYVGEPERSQVRSLTKYAQLEGNDHGSRHEEHVTVGDSVFRVKAGLPEQCPWSQQLNEAKSSEAKPEKLCQDAQNSAMQPRSAFERQQSPAETTGKQSFGRQQSPAETTGKQSSVTQDSQLGDKGVVDAVVTPPATKRENKLLLVSESYTETEEEDNNDDDEYNEDEDKELAYARRRRTCSCPPLVKHRGRKRTVEDRDEHHSMSKAFRHVKREIEDLDPKDSREVIVRSNWKSDSRSKAFRRVKREADDSDPEGTSMLGSTRSTRKSNMHFKQMAAVELDDDYSEETLIAGKHKRSRKREAFQKKKQPDPCNCTIADLLHAKPGHGDKGNKAKAHAGAASEKGHRRGADCDDSDDDCNPSLHEPEKLEKAEKVEKVVETRVPDPDYHNFDNDRTEDLVKADQIWAVYDEKDEMPRAYAHINEVLNSSLTKFAASVTWLKPHQPSEETQGWSESSGYTIACGEFEYAGEDILEEINCFSHQMLVGWVSTQVVKIYPRAGEVWALFKKMEMHNNNNNTTTTTTATTTTTTTTTTTSDSARRRKAQFRLVEILEDVEPGKMPEIQVLGRHKGFHTIWIAHYDRGTLPITNLTPFSHRVPAYRLQGHELPGIFKGSWDIDPAGLPPWESQGGT